jgi:hypothetical protein
MSVEVLIVEDEPKWYGRKLTVILKNETGAGRYTKRIIGDGSWIAFTYPLFELPLMNENVEAENVRRKAATIRWQYEQALRALHSEGD